MTKEAWEKGEERAKMLIEYVKNIGLPTDYRHLDPNRKKERTRNDEGSRKWTTKRITKTTNKNYD
jgi:hypothetical protein